jgi:hypothetical protein
VSGEEQLRPLNIQEMQMVINAVIDAGQVVIRPGPKAIYSTTKDFWLNFYNEQYFQHCLDLDIINVGVDSVDYVAKMNKTNLQNAISSAAKKMLTGVENSIKSNFIKNIHAFLMSFFIDKIDNPTKRNIAFYVRLVETNLFIYDATSEDTNIDTCLGFIRQSLLNVLQEREILLLSLTHPEQIAVVDELILDFPIAVPMFFAMALFNVQPVM